MPNSQIGSGFLSPPDSGASAVAEHHNESSEQQAGPLPLDLTDDVTDDPPLLHLTDDDNQTVAPVLEEKLVIMLQWYKEILGAVV